LLKHGHEIPLHEDRRADYPGTLLCDMLSVSPLRVKSPFFRTLPRRKAVPAADRLMSGQVRGRLVVDVNR
jgi:hypothetical protein